MAFLGDPLFSANFKSELTQLQQTLQRIAPIINDVVKWSQILDRSKQQSAMFIDEIQDAGKLVRKCLKIKRNFIKKFSHSLKLKDVNNKLLRFFQLEVQADQSRDIKQTLIEVMDVNWRIDSLSVDVRQINQTLSSNTLSISSRYELIERGKLGWRVPILPGGIVAFDEPLKKLKAKVFEDLDAYNDGFNGGPNSMEIDDDGGDESSVVVVAAAGGCGKTTLVTMLCHDSDDDDDDDDDDDSSVVVVVSAPAGRGKTILVNILRNDPEIEAKYGENIFYVTVPEKPNFIVMVNDLLNPNNSSQQPMFQSNYEAKDGLGKFLHEQAAYGPILLVLDGVQSGLFIKNFEFKIRGYKILVTSRMIFPKYDVFILDPLSDEDAKALFMCSAFSEFVSIHSPTIDYDLVNQMVKCCKKHPLTLSVVGSSLKGKSEFVWKSVIRSLSQGEWVLDSKDVPKLLERTIERLDEEFKSSLLEFEALDEEFKQCLLDLGLFPNHQRIPAGALLDMWTNLYNHDDMGRDTLFKIFQLADRNLVSSVTIGEEANAIVNYCEQTFITQQDLQRELAIHCSSKEPISQRTRLIMDAQGNDLPLRQVKKVMSARIVSITIGESFSSTWYNMNFPEVEVMVLNIMPQIYTTFVLPHFLNEMQNLKVLIVTNYGLHPTEFENFHLGNLTGLTRIRLEHVVVPLMSASILNLVNLQKLSFIMCKIGNVFENPSIYYHINWPRLSEIEIDSCQDLVRFSQLFCNNVYLEKLSITNCHEMIEIHEDIGNLTSLETLSLRSCTKLEKLPDSISRLKKLSIFDVSDCISLSALPENIGKLGGLQMIYMKGCTGIHELPPSVKDLSQVQVFCNEEISYKWHEFLNVKIPAVEEDRLFTLTENISYAHFQ